jgi:hypothetical protein
MSGTERSRVIWKGKDRWATTEFSRRGLSVENASSKAFDDMATVRALAIHQEDGDPKLTEQLLRSEGADLLNHGVSIFGIANNDLAAGALRQAAVSAGFADSVYIRTDPPDHEIAEKIARLQPGPPANRSLEIIGPASTTLSDTMKLFFQRSFFDCSSISVEPLSEGRSASVFSIHARFKDSVVGPRPLPFFAKIDSRDKIESEKFNYQYYAEHFIPFDLRPNLDPRRCLSGKDAGILVGNFVEKSESLMAAARRGHAQTALFSLFDNTLRGWRHQAQIRQDIVAALSGVFSPDKLLAVANRYPEARSLGATKTPQELEALLKALPSKDFLSAPMHGDLTPFNVRVRGHDAILIDLAHTRQGPLVADPASLEVGLAFEAGNDVDDKGWSDLMNALYSQTCLLRPPVPPREPKAREWLWSSIRQIRVVALAEEISQFEYATALAVYLLRRAMFPADSVSDGFRRAYAYVLAERLISCLGSAHV